MNSRIKYLRKELDLTLEKFATRIGISGGALSNIELGKRNVTTQVIKSICREFNVREEWLKSGTGEIFESLTKEERVAKLLGNIFTDTDSELYNFKMSIFQELGKLDESDWKVLLKIIKGIEWK